MNSTDLKLTKNKYRSWWSPDRAEILTIFPSFKSSLVGETKSTVPPKDSWTSKSFLNFSIRFMASLACLAAVETKWRASENTNGKQLDIRPYNAHCAKSEILSKKLEFNFISAKFDYSLLSILDPKLQKMKNRRIWFFMPKS